MYVEILSDKALKISWSRPLRNYDSITHYYVNISALPGFDSLDTKAGFFDGVGKDTGVKGSLRDQPFFMQIKVCKYMSLKGLLGFELGFNFREK